MKSFFQEMFEYHHYFNQKLLEELIKYDGQLPERTNPLFSHILNAHQVWNSRILNTPSFGVWDVHTLEACKGIEQANYENTLAILASTDFEKVIDYKTSKGQPFSDTVRDILFQVANHSTHHRAQIASDFRQAGLVPLAMDYIFYKRLRP